MTRLMRVPALMLALAAGCGGGGKPSVARIPEGADRALRSALSPDGRFVVLLHDSPVRLEIHDARGGLVKGLHGLSKDGEARCAQLCFVSDDELLLCLSQGVLHRVMLAPDPRTAVLGPAVAIRPGCHTAVAVSASGDVVWLANGDRVFGYQTGTGVLLAELRPELRTAAGDPPPGPIQSLTLAKDGREMVVGLADGRVAPVSLPVSGGPKR